MGAAYIKLLAAAVYKGTTKTNFNIFFNLMYVKYDHFDM